MNAMMFTFVHKKKGVNIITRKDDKKKLDKHKIFLLNMVCSVLAFNVIYHVIAHFELHGGLQIEHVSRSMKMHLATRMVCTIWV